jgi:hypothetical protein
MNSLSLARALGWFSLALGTVELAAPDTLARRLGLGRSGWLLRVFGLREIAAGLAVMARPWSTVGPSARVAGDVLDLAVLATALAPGNGRRRVAGVAAAMVLGVTLLDVACVSALSLRNERALQAARRGRIANARV